MDWKTVLEATRPPALPPWALVGLKALSATDEVLGEIEDRTVGLRFDDVAIDIPIEVGGTVVSVEVEFASPGVGSSRSSITLPEPQVVPSGGSLRVEV